MKTSHGSARAICTFVCLGMLLTAPTTPRAGEPENLARYRDVRVSAGAKTLPVLAREAYRDAITDLGEGKIEAAEKHLLLALQYDPQYSDPHFTLARLKLRQSDPEAMVYAIEGFASLWQSYSMQSLLVLNSVVVVPFILIVVSFIVCLALAVKYLPFAAHRVREFLSTRFKALFPGFSTYLILLVPLVLFPGAVTILAYVTIVCWMFMYRRERVLMLVLLVPIIALGLLGSLLRPLTPIADPKSLTSLIARANDAPGSDRLIEAIKSTPSQGLDTEKNIALGVLYQRSGRYAKAADHFYQAISLSPDDPMGYINLGNVYFLQGKYEKALEGYRKAERIEPNDALCQHGLAQAYIKTLLMKEASASLQLASKLGLERIKSTYARDIVDNIQVFPKTFSKAALWRIAFTEGGSSTQDILNEMMMPFTRTPRNVSALILLGALILGIVLAMIVDPSKLTFQCSNCGNLTCEQCCQTEDDVHLCQECAGTVKGITSDKVSEALLRQKRQTVVVHRRKFSRFVTMLLPGMRDISYGRITRGFYLATLFAVGSLHVWTKGLLLKDPSTFFVDTPLWKMILPAAGIVLSYAMSFLSKPQYSFRAYRPPKSKKSAKEPVSARSGTARVA